jgi:hypothetical protein
MPSLVDGNPAQAGPAQAKGKRLRQQMAPEPTELGGIQGEGREAPAGGSGDQPGGDSDQGTYNGDGTDAGHGNARTQGRR